MISFYFKLLRQSKWFHEQWYYVQRSADLHNLNFKQRERILCFREKQKFKKKVILRVCAIWTFFLLFILAATAKVINEFCEGELWGEL